MKARRCGLGVALLVLAASADLAAQLEQTATPRPVGADDACGELETSATGAASPGRWLGVDGEPLPFASNAQVEHFLATAEVVGRQKIPMGITSPVKLTLEADGVRAHAAFKSVDEERRGVAIEIRGRERVFPTFHDFHLHEVAAYRLDQLLGLDRVPPAVPRKISGTSGTIVMWIEDALTETARRQRGLEPPEPQRALRQIQLMHVFDNIVGNADVGNTGNVLYDRSWKLWFIDCGRCFVTTSQPFTLDKIAGCDRTLWRRLNEVTNDRISAELEPFLGERQLRALLTRKAAVIDHISDLVAARGEEAVLFDLE